MIKKRKILNLIIASLEEKYDVLKRSALEAKDAATNDESKAENKYDTRGLEASYLAGAQAKRTEELKESIFYLNKIKDDELIKNEKVGLFSLVKLLVEEETEKHFFVLPVQGGLKVSYDDQEINTLTLSSPLGKKIHKKEVDEDFELKSAKDYKYYEIIDIE